MLACLDTLPPGFLETSTGTLHEVLPGPTLIHLPGRRPEPLFVSVLLHGNEPAGLGAIQRVLRKYAGHSLPRALSIFVGNVEAARAGVRRLEGQPDFNRIWPGVEPVGTEEQAMAATVTEAMRARRPFASIDIHNNTGLNPHYACITRLDRGSIQLAALFSRIVIHFTRPKGVQTLAFSPFCPSVVLECAKPGDSGAEAHAAEFVDACLHLSQFPSHPVAAGDVELYHTVATVKVPEEVTFGFGEEEAGIVFARDIDHFNFRELMPGFVLGRVPNGDRLPLEVIDESGAQVGDAFFEVRDGVLVARKPLVPAMLTLDARAIRQDCLCYLMERLLPPG